jgi:hypothetical protein
MSLVSSVIAGTAVWLGQRLLRYRRLARKRAFFGVSPATGCVLVSPRHFSSPQPASVHRHDMAALVELATVVNECGGRAEIVSEQTGLPGVGRLPEFCVGGPPANSRTAAHLRSLLPGVHIESPPSKDDYLAISVGRSTYRHEPHHAAYAVLAKTHLPATGHPLFLLSGQTAQTNLAGARLLASQYRTLLRTYGATGRFCLVLRIVEPEVYGPDLVEIAADVTGVAFQPPASPDPAPPLGLDGPEDETSLARG